MHVLWNISATMPSLRTHVLFQQSNAPFRIRLHAQESSSETRSIPHHFTIQYIQQPYYLNQTKPIPLYTIIIW